MSAFTPGRSGSADGRDAVALATRGSSPDAKGTSAPSTAAHATATPSPGQAAKTPDRHYRAGLAVTGVLAAALLSLFAANAIAAPILGDSCPNGDLRKAQGTAFFPDCMALEQVSPRLKENQPARILYVDPAFGSTTPGAISSNGDRVVFVAATALGGTPALQSVFGDQYVASRSTTGQGWETAYTSPASGYTRGWTETPEARSFTADLSRWFQVASSRKQFEAGLGQAFRGGLGGIFDPFSPLLVPHSGQAEASSGFVTFTSKGAPADGSRLYFTGDRTITYLPGDPTPDSGTDRNTYIALPDATGSPSLQLLARDGDGKVWGERCGAQVGGNPVPQRNLGAISADGSRTFFTTRPDQLAGVACDSASNKKRIMVREETAAGVEIRELFPSPPGVGDDLYQGASLEGDKVYLTTIRPLVASDIDGATDLYLYDASESVGEELANVSGAGTAVPNVAAISGDGSHAYFNSADVLTADPGPGIPNVAQAGQNNLYVYDAVEEEISFIAITGAGSAYPVPVLGPDPTALGVGGDGHRLFFTSSASLTNDDTDGGFSDVFRYDASNGELTRISRAAPDGADNGPFNVIAGAPLGTPVALDNNSPDFAVRSRWVSEDGETVSFKTQDGLVPDDNNGVMDSFVWRGSQPFRLPGTADQTNGLIFNEGLQDRPLISPDGGTIAFQTFAPLLPRDGDSTVDVYAARVNGGFPEPPPEEVCMPDGDEECQGPVGADPGGAGIGSATQSGRGNLVSESPPRRRCPKGKRRVRRSGKARCVKTKARGGKAPKTVAKGAVR